MTDQQITDLAITNGKSANNAEPRARRQRQWKEMEVDPLAEGFEVHQADYVVGKTQVGFDTLSPGQLFSRTKSGKSLYVKLNDGRGVCLDTRQPIEVSPQRRKTWQIWLVTNFNSTTAIKTDF
ncbi:hypothetical protein CDG76_30645 [Nostoc sp. 'Peltigera membranacea cyanobiont' 210A]|uniref:hypothetical protein n=1 Tax=Nostoc sp. 'Peltigera membranacea cyanobiont' 210A TaxID=2014529 RepID=UPI000B958249|nr:hypothetical protein [Nostoc sp. 'Peltigera membranacea cyanobiont' 210A]OYD90585.1 hypothetical protein CDG76_30645 [Nostoc sp. 'Peltigera membranacea cyanobiont' 210A]